MNECGHGIVWAYQMLHFVQKQMRVAACHIDNIGKHSQIPSAELTAGRDRSCIECANGWYLTLLADCFKKRKKKKKPKNTKRSEHFFSVFPRYNNEALTLHVYMKSSTLMRAYWVKLALFRTTQRQDILRVKAIEKLGHMISWEFVDITTHLPACAKGMAMRYHSMANLSALRTNSI
jgi:hypothetical protein